MSEEMQDFEKKPDEAVLESEGDGSNPSRRLWVGIAVVVVLIAVAWIWFIRGNGDESLEPAAPAVPVASEPEPAEEPDAQLDLGDVPTLVDSDTWLREIVGQISSHPQLAEWLVTPELIRGFVVVVDNLAEGKSPHKHLDMAAPETRFGVREDQGKVFVDPANYHRFDLLVDVIESLDTTGTSELYAAIRPLCQQAYQDLGYPAEDFDATLRRAIQRVLATPVVDGPIELVPKVRSYEFSDPELEDLSPAAKQFLRLGPENLQRLQVKLRALSRAVGL
jgi:hypothetical protein